ncbi:hypothetical protein BDN72DRAFT_327548 [Pluteus cervinus]|uniref:Uncharacterized protein n=1 Tax=Pluteus cervinus TaxID=181527 RepID=A0ACD3B3U6_9AGAR|nr:hypothetical protein BDN72DRAFT_327548 [Pluteus cervinus]
MSKTTSPDVPLVRTVSMPTIPLPAVTYPPSAPGSSCGTIVQRADSRASKHNTGNSSSDVAGNGGSVDEGSCGEPLGGEKHRIVTGLAPISPQESQRYQRSVVHTRNGDELNLRPLTRDFDSFSLPKGWERFVQPDGYPFFFNKDKRILTTTDICTDKILEQVNDIYDNAIRFWDTHHSTIARDNNWHLVLENYINSKQQKKFGYYFVDHSKECLFWLDEYDVRDMDDSVKIRSSNAHIGRLMKSQFWYHCEAYPNVYPVTESILNRMQDVLVNALGDSLTSTDSTIPYDVKTLREMLDLVNDMKVPNGKPDSSAGTARVLFRFMASFEHERFRNLYGEAGARLVLGQTIYAKPDKKKRTLMMKMLLPLFFFAPREHLRRLETITVDHMVNLKSWNELLDRLTDDWKEHTLYATVLLNANVAFLAIQSVDSLGQSPIQQISYVSTALSIGTIVMALLLVKQHHTLPMQYLANRSVSTLGLETLSLLYSLPYASLMWGMITFFLAFATMCFSKGNTLTSCLMGISGVVIVSFIFWCISLYYERELYVHPWLFRKWHSLLESRWFNSIPVRTNRRRKSEEVLA